MIRAENYGKGRPVVLLKKERAAAVGTSTKYRRHMKGIIIVLAFTLMLNVAALGQSPAVPSEADAKKAALAIVEQLFTEMAAANPAGILALGTPENQLVAIRKMRDGKTKVEVITGDAFSKMFTNKAVLLREEMYAPQVEVEGDYAMVYGRYVFFVGDKLSHCGVNQFNLVRVDGTWKIANGASTIDPTNCNEKEKAMKPDPAKWPAAKAQ